MDAIKTAFQRMEIIQEKRAYIESTGALEGLNLDFDFNLKGKTFGLMERRFGIETEFHII